MTRQEHLLTITGEECSEVHQRCSKAMRFGMAEIEPIQTATKMERVVLDFNDLVAAMEMLYDCPINDLISRNLVSAKKTKIETYLEYSKECGTIS